MEAKSAPIKSTDPLPSDPPAFTPSANTSSTLAPLLVDFSWRKFQSLISPIPNVHIPNQSTDPVYIADFRMIRSPHIILRHYTSSSTKLPSGRKAIESSPDTVGTGTLHVASVNASTTVRGLDAQLTASSKFHTTYTHLSRAFAPTNGDAPLTLQWTSASDFKTWDFICSDPRTGQPIAKFGASWWALHKTGTIEFMESPSTVDEEELRDEIATVGLVIFNLMILRINNLLAFFAAIFYRPAAQAEKNREKVRGETVGASAGRFGGRTGNGNGNGRPAGYGKAGGREEVDELNDASDEEKWGARRLEQENREEEELAGLEKGSVKV